MELSRTLRGNSLQDRPIVSSILITILTGLTLQMSNIIDLQLRIGEVLNDFVLVRLVDITFRMTMGGLLVFLVIPLLLGFFREEGWLTKYLTLMRVSMGRSPRRTVWATILSFLAFVLVLVAFSFGAGVFSSDPGVLIDDNGWLILFAALVPAIWEELTFRGVILANLEHRFKPRRAVVVSSVLFGLFHFSNFLNWDDTASVVFGVIAAALLGFGWGFIVIVTNSIFPAIVLHYLVDVLLFDELFIDPAATDDSTSVVYLGLVVLYPALTILATRLLFKNEQPLKPQPANR